MPKHPKMVRVLLGPDSRAIRIFRNKDWLTCDGEMILVKRSAAVGQIRDQVFERAKNPETGQFECEKCGRIITWETGEMNEKRPRGAGGGFTGGEVSLENCEALCHGCHQGEEDSAHGNRRWHSSKILSEEGLQ